MTSAYRSPRLRVPWRMRLGQLGRAAFVLSVLALIPVFLWLQTRDSTTLRFGGLVEAESETVGPTTTARILALAVEPGQEVKPGDVLVRLEAPDRAADLALSEARLQDYEQGVLRYEQDAQRQRYSLQESARRCRQAALDASVALEAETMDRARDEAELTALKAEIARLQPLVERRLMNETELSALRPKAQALEQALAQYAPLISALRRRHEQALADLQEVVSRLDAVAADHPVGQHAAAIRQAVAACREAVAVDATVLRATRAGVVSRVWRQAGDVVVAGEPVVRVTALDSRRITGMLAQRQLDGLAVGDRLRVARLVGDRRPTVAAQVVSIDPEVMDLLDPLNPTPRYPLRGRRVRLQVLEGADRLIPGEAVTLETGQPETWLEGVRRIGSLCGLGRSRPPSAVADWKS